jgi:hypothetical protein
MDTEKRRLRKSGGLGWIERKEDGGEKLALKTCNEAELLRSL